MKQKQPKQGVWRISRCGFLWLFCPVMLVHLHWWWWWWWCRSRLLIFSPSDSVPQWYPPPWQSWQDLLGSMAQLQVLLALQVSCPPSLSIPPYPLLLADLHTLLLLPVLANLASYFSHLFVLWLFFFLSGISIKTNKIICKISTF